MKTRYVLGVGTVLSVALISLEKPLHGEGRNQGRPI